MPPRLPRNWPGLLIIGFCFNMANAQVQKPIYHWCNLDSAGVSFNKGKAWQQGLSHLYHRLPEKSKNNLTLSYWSISENTAGEYIDFKTDASSIITGIKPAKSPYILTTKEINLDLDATVDGLRPKNIEMSEYEKAYENQILDILKNYKKKLKNEQKGICKKYRTNCSRNGHATFQKPMDSKA